MLDSLRDNLKTTYVIHITIALDNDGEAVYSQKLGGYCFPSSIEKKIAATMKEQKRRKFIVFPEEVINWVSEEIRETKYTDMFPKSIPSRGWYRGWLS